MNSNPLAIDVKNLSKSFAGKQVIKDVSIQVPRGKIFGFLGPNGSGKTTTIRLICGLLTANSGSGTCLGYDIFNNSENIRAKTGYMTQKFSFWEDLTIKENIEFVADMYSIKNSQERVEEAIHNLGLKDRENQLAGKLSGGWKQRLALAACILHKPDLLLLDEPTAGVDPKARRDFWDEIHKLAAQGLTVLVSTHYMDEAERCNEIIYIANGQIVTKGTISEVIAASGLYTAVVKGSNLNYLRNTLEKDSRLASVAPFGDSLHVCAQNKEALESAIGPYVNNSEYSWTYETASMEDAFIHFMSQAEKKRKVSK
ncbi:MAG: ABC transporter ATP-binding protein [Candidatus Caenarcaniphilales bacterium]|nr:ABC transporter ATP-binding protein [Candidatus Caenarcaniphilales bacterium]